jgi:uncharacterized zinc-type alcohol dehydrogenase-like protein
MFLLSVGLICKAKQCLQKEKSQATQLLIGRLLFNLLQGSGIGGIANTQAVIDLCARHNIVPELKVLPVEKLNQIFRDLDTGNDQGTTFVAF